MPRLLFEKKGDSIWISHLDTMRVFQRAFRRAGLLLKHSQGFTPRAIVSIALPLSVGVESRCELLDFELENDAPVTPQILNKVLPSGICVLEVLENGKKIKELTQLKAHLVLEYDKGITDDTVERMNAFFKQETIMIEKHSRKGKTETNIAPMIKSLEIRKRDDQTLDMEVLVCAQNPSLNPQLMITALELYVPELAPDYVAIRREEIFDANGEVFR